MGTAAQPSITVIPLSGIPEVSTGDDLSAILVTALRDGPGLHDGDVIVVAQKIVSKAEGRVVALHTIAPGQRALDLGAELDRDPRLVQVILGESREVVRAHRALIVETHSGFICANAGVDQSNVPGDDVVTLLPEDCDASAQRLRTGLQERLGVAPGVIISDSFGRPWRMGVTDVALGVAGLAPLHDHRGRDDDFGRTMQSTVVAVADELAGAAELAMGKTGRTPAVLIRGFQGIDGAANSGDRTTSAGDGNGQDLLRPRAEDLFRS